MYVRLSVLSVCLSSMLFLGCGGDVPRGNVAGKVYVGEKLATAGEVKFHGSNGQVVGAQIQSDGSFKALAVPAGEVKVTVLPAPILMSKTAPPKGVETISAGEGDKPSESTSKSPPIPLKYATTESSGLSLTLIVGNNTYDVKMAPGPAAPPPAKVGLPGSMPGKIGAPVAMPK